MAALASALGLSGLARLGWGCPITTASPTHAAQSVPQDADHLRPCRGATEELGIFRFIIHKYKTAHLNFTLHISLLVYPSQGT